MAEAIKDLEYFPSIAARQLKSNASNTISLHLIIPADGVIQHSTWSFFFPIIQGFVSSAKKAQFRAHLEFNTPEELSDFSSIQSFVVGHQLAGSAFVILHAGDYSSLVRLARIGRRVVTVYSKVDDSVASICTNNMRESQSVVQWLRKLGHKHVGFVNGVEWHTASLERKAGYEAGMVGTGYKKIYPGDWTIRSGIAALKYFIALDKPPTAIFCANDHMAIGVIKACQVLRIRIPEDISLVGFDDNFVSQVTEPRLTSVRMPLTKMGEAAALALIRSSGTKGSLSEAHQVFPSRMILRNSAIARLRKRMSGSANFKGAIHNDGKPRKRRTS